MPSRGGRVGAGGGGGGGAGGGGGGGGVRLARVCVWISRGLVCSGSAEVACGRNKVAVEEKAFVKELEKTEKFTEEEARNYIRRMLREASIYESKPGHYNLV